MGKDSTDGIIVQQLPEGAQLFGSTKHGSRSGPREGLPKEATMLSLRAEAGVESKRVWVEKPLTHCWREREQSRPLGKRPGGPQTTNAE